MECAIKRAAARKGALEVERQKIKRPSEALTFGSGWLFSFISVLYIFMLVRGGGGIEIERYI